MVIGFGTNMSRSNYGLCGDICFRVAQDAQSRLAVLGLMSGIGLVVPLAAPQSDDELSQTCIAQQHYRRIV